MRDQNTRIGNCKNGTCVKLEDLQIDSAVHEDFPYVRESMTSLAKKEGYDDLKNVPKDKKITLFKKICEIRNNRLLEWKEKQLEKVGICPNHS